MSQSSDDQQLKQYEREILRARSRVQVADLDTEIDKLIEHILGKLTKTQHKQYQATRISGFMAANPELIIANRVLFLSLTEQQVKRLAAPDVLTMEEMASLVVIMRAIRQWLQNFVDSGETSLTFQELIGRASLLAVRARDQFYAIYQRFPSLHDVPENVMTVIRAREIQRIADRTGLLLPDPLEGEQ